MDKQVLSCDVLVMGGGAAALKAAISAFKRGADVLVVSKGLVGESGATWHDVAEIGAFNAPDGAADPTDNPDVYYEDILAAADGAADPRLCRILADGAVEALRELEEMSGGAVFQKNGGQYQVYQACFSSKSRSHVIGDHFRPLLTALRNEAERLGVRSVSGVAITDLLVDEGVCCGAYGLDGDGKPVVVGAKSVVLGAGGASKLFGRNMYPDDITGDGYAMAHRAGATLANMDFIQMGIGMAHPFINLIGNYLWDCVPAITDAGGRELIAKHLPAGLDTETVEKTKRAHFPFSSRDCSKYVEIAVQSEINSGNVTPNGNVLMDFSKSDPEGFFARTANAGVWRHTHEWFLRSGIDLTRQPIEIACFAHAINGGVLIGPDAQSSLPGLFAAGENAAGPHGADRLGGNMSVTSQVFGKIAGERAAAFAESRGGAPECSRRIAEIEGRIAGLKRSGGVPLAALRRELQDMTNRSLLILRDESGLVAYLRGLEDLENRLRAEADVPTDRDAAQAAMFLNLLEVGGIVARSALFRKESRGSQYRTDCPDRDAAYDGSVVSEGGFIALRKLG